jgi:hypothetical protein
MKHGIRIVCPDGEPRLFFPRVFTYAADYPEKWVVHSLRLAHRLSQLTLLFLLAPRTLVAGTRSNGVSPCHRCLVPKSELYKLGAPIDTERRSPRSDSEANEAIDEARKEIFERGLAVDTTKVEDRLKPLSLVPTLVSQPLFLPSGVHYSPGW